jgi:hypothetical protein
MSQATTSKLTVSCPQCGQVASVPRAYIGKKGRCQKCQAVYPIAEPAADPLGSLSPLATSLAGAELDLPSDNAIWSQVQVATPTAPTETSEVTANLSNDYLTRARNDKGGTIEQEESDPTYRWVTSYGSVIGGIATIFFGIFLILLCLFLLGSLRLTAASVLVVIAGVGWLVQGLNYVTYYRWKDAGGRKQ